MTDVKIFVKLADPDLPDAESMRAEPLGGMRYRLLNVPFYARNLALGDVLECEEKNGQKWFKRRVKRSGNGTIRIFSGSGFGTGRGRKVISELESRGFVFEFLGSLAAGNIPSGTTGADLAAVERYIARYTGEDLFYEIPVA
jgi:hypothetical protein